VNLTALKGRIAECFELIEATDLEWRLIIKHMNIQKRWFFFYLNYCFFIHNEKLKHKILDECEFQGIKTPFLEEEGTYANGEKGNLFDPQFLFDRNTFYLRTFMEEGQMFIKSVSNNFQSVTHFTREEIHNGHITIILDN